MILARKRTEERRLFTVNEELQILINSGHRCAHCGKKLSMNKKQSGYTIEHVIPLNKGGTNDLKNLVALCFDCNEAKSDHVISPESYYQYLPKERLEELTKIFEDYMHETHWLGRNNLFRLDKFRIPTKFPYQKNPYHPPVMGNGIMDVEKMKRDAAFQWLYAYTARLSPEDKNLMISSEENVKTPYYRVYYNKKDVLIFTAYVNRPCYKNADGEVYDDDKEIIEMQIFVNPDLKDLGKPTDCILWSILSALMHEVQFTLVTAAPNSIIDMEVISPHSDQFAMRLYDLAAWSMPQGIQRIRYKDKEQTDGYTEGVSLSFFQGTTEQMTSAIRERGYANLQELSEDKPGLIAFEDELYANIACVLDEEPEKETRIYHKKHKNHAKKASRKKRQKANLYARTNK